MNFTPKLEVTKDAKFESVTKYMATDLVTFTPDDEIGNVMEMLLNKKISGAPVLNDKRELVGMISEQDCLRVVIDSVYYNQPLSKHLVKEYMTTELLTIDVKADVVDVANMFLKHRFRRFPVVENGVLRGQVSKRDILRAAKNLKFTTW